jgi:hypothetical protein
MHVWKCHNETPYQVQCNICNKKKKATYLPLSRPWCRNAKQGKKVCSQFFHMLCELWKFKFPTMVIKTKELTSPWSSYAKWSSIPHIVCHTSAPTDLHTHSLYDLHQHTCALTTADQNCFQILTKQYLNRYVSKILSYCDFLMFIPIHKLFLSKNL